jgi:hypothetical protein
LIFLFLARAFTFLASSVMTVQSGTWLQFFGGGPGLNIQGNTKPKHPKKPAFGRFWSLWIEVSLALGCW